MCGHLLKACQFLQNKRKRKYPTAQCELGNLEDLRSANKGGLDPNGKGSTLVATDVLWSDPVLIEGLELNVQRGIGVVFGPNITEVRPLAYPTFHTITQVSRETSSAGYPCRKSSLMAAIAIQAAIV